MELNNKIFIGVITFISILFVMVEITNYAVVYGDETDEYYFKGQEYVNNNQYYEAIKEFNKALEIQPDNVTILNYKGYSLNQINSFQEGLEVLDKAVKLDPSYDNALSNKAYSLYGLGQYDKALELVDKSIQQMDDDNKGKVDMYALKGGILQQQHKYFESMENYDKALKLGYYQPEEIMKNKEIMNIQMGY